MHFLFAPGNHFHFRKPNQRGMLHIYTKTFLCSGEPISNRNPLVGTCYLLTQKRKSHLARYSFRFRLVLGNQFPLEAYFHFPSSRWRFWHLPRFFYKKIPRARMLLVRKEPPVSPDRQLSMFFWAAVKSKKVHNVSLYTMGWETDGLAKRKPKYEGYLRPAVPSSPKFGPRLHLASNDTVF